MDRRVAPLGLAAAALLGFGTAAALLRGPSAAPLTLAFQGRGSTGYEIRTMDGDGAHGARLPIPAEGSVGAPRFSPDGRRIAFIGDGCGGVEDLYVADVVGGEAGLAIRNLRVVARSCGVPEGAPAWSPDGGEIAFSTWRDADWEIYVVDLSANRMRRLTVEKGFDAAPAWDPTGRLIAFQSDRRGGDSHIYVMRPDGTGVRQITFGEDEGSPDWSPDGRLLAFAGFSRGNADIWVIPAGGGAPQRLTRSDQFEYTPRWSPNGAFIAFESYEGQEPDIFVVQRDGSGRRRLTKGNGYAGAPAWRPTQGDGRPA